MRKVVPGIFCDFRLLSYFLVFNLKKNNYNIFVLNLNLSGTLGQAIGVIVLKLLKIMAAIQNCFRLQNQLNAGITFLLNQKKYIIHIHNIFIWAFN